MLRSLLPGDAARVRRLERPRARGRAARVGPLSRDEITLQPLDERTSRAWSTITNDIGDLPESCARSLPTRRAATRSSSRRWSAADRRGRSGQPTAARHRCDRRGGDPSRGGHHGAHRPPRRAKRHILQLASVIGRSFSYGVIVELVDRARTCPTTSATCATKQILVEQGPRWDIAGGRRRRARRTCSSAGAGRSHSSILSRPAGRCTRASRARRNASRRPEEELWHASYHCLRAEDLPNAEATPFAPARRRAGGRAREPAAP